jgi:DNA-binding response OmpR family regulator
MTLPADASSLVVDDDIDTCRNLTDILSDLGYQVDMAYDGPSALEKFRRRSYDVALLDFKMPGMNGLEVYREIKRLSPATVAIVVSAYTDPSTHQAALGAGAVAVLPKPVDFSKLQAQVDAAVSQPLVLVVDDDPELCASLWDLMRDSGYRVSLAFDVATAGDRLRNKRFRIVLIDMQLPDGDGSAVARQVRQVNPSARTVIITGHREELDGRVRQALDEGANAVCYKPFDVPQLLATLERLTRSEAV